MLTKLYVIFIIFSLTVFVGCESTIRVSDKQSTNRDSSDSDEVTLPTCPTGYVEVKGNGLFGTSDFCVMKYEAKNVSGEPISQMNGSPWGNILPADAQSGCESLSVDGYDGNFSLISNAEWMTIARDAETNVANWSGGSIGSGHIPRGHTDNSPAMYLPVSDASDHYDGTGNSSSDTPGSGWEQKRVHILSNGSEVWDMAGNIYEWVDWDESTSGFNLGPTGEGGTWKEFSVGPTATLTLNEYKPNDDSLTSTSNSIGQWYGGSGGAALRGGVRDKGDEGGIYTLLLVVGPSVKAAAFGFRCVYRP